VLYCTSFWLNSGYFPKEDWQGGICNGRVCWVNWICDGRMCCVVWIEFVMGGCVVWIEFLMGGCVVWIEFLMGGCVVWTEYVMGGCVVWIEFVMRGYIVWIEFVMGGCVMWIFKYYLNVIYICALRLSKYKMGKLKSSWRSASSFPFYHSRKLALKLSNQNARYNNKN
jgi:hypothetical protein